MATTDPRIRITATDKTRAAFTSAQRNVAGLRKSITGLQASFAGLAGAALVGGIVRTAAQFETLGKTLETVTGSSRAANTALAAIKEFAATTPFQLQEVVDAFIKLKALGLDPSKEALTAYGNVASAMGKSLNQFIEAIADAATGEFERLKEFGIKAKSQGDQVTFIFQGVATTVGKNADEINGYLQSIGNNQFAGAMERQSDTLNVALSNLKDAFANLAVEFAEGSGLVSGIKTFTKVMTEAAAAAQTFFRNIFGGSTAIQAAEVNLASITAKLEGERTRLEALKRGDLIARLFGDEKELEASVANLERAQNSALLVVSRLKEQAGIFDDGTNLGGGAGGGGAGGTGPDAAELKAIERAQREEERLREQMARKLELIRESTLSETDLLTTKHEERMFFLEEAFQNELISFQSLQEQKLALEAQYQARLSEIDAKEQAKRLKQEQDQQKYSIAGAAKYAQTLIGASATMNKQLFTINKIAAISEAILSFRETVVDAYRFGTKIGGPPLGAVMAGIATAAQLANIAAIASTSYGDTGGGGGGGASSAVPTYDVDPVFGIPETSNRTIRQDVTINLGDDDTLLSTSAVRNLIDKINEQIDDGVVIGSIVLA